MVQTIPSFIGIIGYAIALHRLHSSKVLSSCPQFIWRKGSYPP